MSRHRGVALALAAMSAVLLWNCGGGDDGLDITPAAVDPDAVRAAVDRGAGLDPASFAGEIMFRIPADLPVRSEDIPIVVYAGLSPVSDTRLGANALVDLRLVQIRLPELLSGVVVEECGQEVTLDLAGVGAEGDRLRAGGTVAARFFRCRGEGTPEEARGVRIFSMTVDAVAVATAAVRDDCVFFDLVDLQLDPQGLIGGLASLLGFTERARQGILRKAETVLAEKPVCPELPETLSSLAPSFTSGGPREVGEGGIGAALGGSVDVSAGTLVSLLAVLKERRLVEGQR